MSGRRASKEQLKFSVKISVLDERFSKEFSPKSFCNELLCILRLSLAKHLQALNFKELQILKRTFHLLRFFIKGFAKQKASSLWVLNASLRFPAISDVYWKKKPLTIEFFFRFRSLRRKRRTSIINWFLQYLWRVNSCQFLNQKFLIHFSVAFLRYLSKLIGRFVRSLNTMKFMAWTKQFDKRKILFWSSTVRSCES